MLRPIILATSQDERLLGYLKDFSDKADEWETVTYKLAFKKLCDIVRKSLNETRVIGFAELKSDVPTIAIFIYDIEATDDNYYFQRFDENNQPYIEGVTK